MANESRADGWVNTYTALGSLARDKRLSAVAAPPPKLSPQELEDLYHGNDLAARMCSLPALEMVRQWITVKAGDDPELGKGVLQALETLKAQKTIGEALTWARLHGGSIVYLGADQGQGDRPELPLVPERVRALRFLTVFDRTEVTIDRHDEDLTSPTYGQPLFYRMITPGQDVANRVKQGTLIHASRVLHFDGTRTTRRRKRGYNQHWADSIFVRLYDVLRAYGTTWESAEALLQDFAQAVIKIKSLAEMVAMGGEDKIKERMQIIDMGRSVLRAMLLDADNEDFERKPTPITGLPEMLDRWLYRVSSAVGIPITLLFGLSPGGLNATGESDIRFFYDSIRAAQEQELRPQLEKLLTVLFNSAEGPTQGREPAAWSFEFVPLRQLSEMERADLRLKMAQADAVYLDRQVVSPAEVAVSRFGGDDYSIDTVLDEGARDVMARAEQDAEAVKAEAEAQAAAALAAPPNPPPPPKG